MPKAINKVNQGMHRDFNEYDQPPNTMRDNRNGIITDLDEGAFMWTNMEGTRQMTFELASTDTIMASVVLRDVLYLIVFNDDKDYVIIYQAYFNSEGDTGYFSRMWEGENSILNLSLDHPIRAIFGYYEDTNIKRIYWTDYHNPPRVINIGDNDRLTLQEKFINFFPVINNGYGNISFSILYGGGVCKAGTYFFAWRYFNEGYFTDWSYLSPGVQVTPVSGAGDYGEYHNVQGGAPDEICNKRIRVDISNIDTDYESIQVAAFYSNDYNSAAPGFIFYDGDITGAIMEFYLRGNENLGTVSIDDLMEVTTKIEKCKDMMHVSKMNVMANIEEREELDLTNVAPFDKNNQIEVSMKPIIHGCLLDTAGYPNTSWETSDDPNDKPLYGIRANLPEITEGNYLIPGLWYMAFGGTVLFTDDNGAQSIAENEVFRVVSDNKVTPSGGTGTAIGVIVKKKYLPASAGSDDINEHELDVIMPTGFLNYKNPEWTYHLKGYPGGERIRLGVVFYDTTGRPYFARHLYNIEETFDGHTIGPGDIDMPPREGNKDWGVFTPSNVTTSPTYNIRYDYIVGNILGIEVSGIDITSIKDQISGFSIVRAPIVRTRLAYGYLIPLLEDNDEITVNAEFVIDAVDSSERYLGSYMFYCPEEHYELTDFSINPGDELVNAYYLRMYDEELSISAGIPKLGRVETSYVTNDPQAGYYAKLAVYSDPGDTDYPSSDNAAIGEAHEVKASTRITPADADGDGVLFNPQDSGAIFISKTQNNEYSDSSYATNGTIIVLDIDESSNNFKGQLSGSYQPHILVCYVHRTNSSPYGGTGDASLSNTLYESTGHFQEINDTVLADVYDGSRYIFNGIDVYGGDTFIGMFCHTRLLKNWDLGANQFSHTVIMPVESRINLDYREGAHAGKDRTYDETNNTSGLRWEVGAMKLEEFNYNDGYSTDDISDYYLPFPFNTRLQKKFDTRIRYSDVKSYGERQDSFRQFQSGNRLDLGTEHGELNNIKARNSRLIYWQRDIVGYVPINERALTPNQFGQPIELGTGEAFSRYDDLTNRFIGNSNQFGLTESPIGFHWYDAIRKNYVTLNNSMQFEKDSIVKGLDSWFTNEILSNMDLRDNPVDYEGVVSGYDPAQELVLTTFRIQGQTPETILLDVKTNKFVGFMDFQSRMYFNYKNWLYSVSDGNNVIFQHGEGVFGQYHGVSYPQYFTIIIKGESNFAKIFDKFEYIGSQNTFTKLMYETIDQNIEENIALNRNIKYRNRRYYGTFPKVSRERLTNGWLKMTFYYEGSESVTFNEILTTFRNSI